MIESLANIGVSIKTGSRRPNVGRRGRRRVVSDEARRISADEPDEMFIANAADGAGFTAALSRLGANTFVGDPSGCTTSDRDFDRPRDRAAWDGWIVPRRPEKCPPVEIDSRIDGANDGRAAARREQPIPERPLRWRADLGQ